MSTKRSHILKQTCSFQLQICLSMCDILVNIGTKGLSKFVRIDLLLFPQKSSENLRFLMILEGKEVT